MALTYRALGLLLTYPSDELRAGLPDIESALLADPALPAPIGKALSRLVATLAAGDLLDRQEEYVWLFDRTRSLSLNLYEHVHGESRDRGQAMAALLELYRQHGLELAANELPDFLPAFLDFLSSLPDEKAASLLAEALHVLAAIGERLHKRGSPYRAVFGALTALAGQVPDAAALAALLDEPDDDPADLAALDKQWAETAVTFGPGEAGCPKVATAAMNPSSPAATA
ncbi:nitrate reductase molybdenum cofactor assembly chaperone [Caulobacter segnis]|uniref:nitrate reductase molybdenum cofactor assembly chaperone n=1 Tax=Caulobacter segnis TaxID=88688 RepID=UPI00286538D0|nr:nitrate reductase molybdenum cofactor assembly chaperone [Caulobacter segnis]MDR6623901.1 nitrate reductase delta subunit [Caulobacter segnis]